MDPVVMVSSLAPVLANIFMSFYESKWLNEYNLNIPRFYLRYIDGIVDAFDNEQDSLNFLNNRHPNIEFTIKNKLTIPSLFLMYSFQVTIIRI